LDKYFGDEEPKSFRETTDLGTLTIRSKNKLSGVEYTPSPFLVMDWVLASLNVNREDWTFIDIGSGRGRMVLKAAKMSFAKVVGVEFAKELHDEATDYIEKIAISRLAARNIELINGDATQFQIPDGPCVFYLFNPFGPDVVEKFLDHVLESHAINPRPLKFAYSNPVHANVFASRNGISMCRLSLIEKIKFGLLSPHRYALFEIDK